MIRGTRVKLGWSKKSVTILIIIFCYSFGIITAIFGLDFCLTNRLVYTLFPALLIIGLSAIALSVFCFISTCIGTCGVINDSVITIEIYGVLLIFLTILYSALATYVLNCSLTFQQSFTEKMKKAFQNYHKDEISKKAVDSLQYLVSCCGLDGPKYWSELVILPNTCCSEEFNMYFICTEEISVKIGCKVKAVKHYINTLRPLYVNYYSTSILSLIFGAFMIWNSKTSGKITQLDGTDTTEKAYIDATDRISSIYKLAQEKRLAPEPRKFLGFLFAKSEPLIPEIYGQKLTLQPQQQSLSLAKDKKDRAPSTVQQRAKKNEQPLSQPKIAPLSPRKHAGNDDNSYLQPSTSRRK